MAVCSWCKQNMTSADSCTVATMHVVGRVVPMRAWGNERHWPRSSGRCGDCGVQPGGLHHLGCDIQECPWCDGQLLSCGCWYDEYGPRDDDDDDDDGWYDDEAEDSDEDDDTVVEPLGIDAAGNPVEMRTIGGQQVEVHYGDIPLTDVTTVDGIPCTTALRTVIDIAADVERSAIERAVTDSLLRGLFSPADAWRRVGEPDMAKHRGAEIIRDVLRSRGL